METATKGTEMNRDEMMDIAQEALVNGRDAVAELQAQGIGRQVAEEVTEATARHPITKILIQQNA